MKVMAFSDLHGNAARAAALCVAAKDADLVIAAGDFCNMRRGLGEAMDLLWTMTCPIIAVPGNAESADELRAAAPDNMTVLHGEGLNINGLSIFGIGYGIPPTPFGEWSCDLTEEFAEQLLGHCNTADILVTHSPPKGIADKTSQGQSVGSVAIHQAVERIQPKLVLCGHIHDSWGESGMIGESRVQNLGPKPNWFDL